MPQAAQQDYLRLAIAKPTALTDAEMATIKRYIRDGIIMDVLVENGSKTAKILTLDQSGAVPVIKTTENTITLVQALSAAIDEVEANVGETLTAAATVTTGSDVSVTFSEKLAVGEYSGIIKTTTESVSVTFAVATAPNATVSVELTEGQAAKIASASIESITVTTATNSTVVAEFAVESAG